MHTFARRYTFLLYLTHKPTIGIAEPQIEYQLACTGGPVNDTSIVEAASTVDHVSRRGSTEESTRNI